MKLKMHTLHIKRFLPHSLVFYPTFLTMSIIQIFESLFFTVFHGISCGKSWGKKLVRGQKTFDFKNMNLQLSFAQKIIKKYSKLATMAQNEIWIC